MSEFRLGGPGGQTTTDTLLPACPSADRELRSTAPVGTSGETADAAVGWTGDAASHQAEPNRLLRALPREEYQRLLVQLDPVRLRSKQILMEAGEPIANVYFVREGVGSMIATGDHRGGVEVGTIGNEGFIGLPVLHSTQTMPYRVMVPIEGMAWRLSTEAFRRVVDERPVVRDLLLRYAQYFTNQLAQGVACNRLHTIDARCARWLLMTHDRVQGDAFEVTHEFLALMLGVRRAGVTVAMRALQNAGIVAYTRGHVAMQDRARLEQASCECYQLTRASLERLVR